MDYKFVILLLVIIAVFMFLYKELDNIKNDIKSKFEELTEATTINLRNMRSKFQTDLGTCVSRIKTHNADFINQARRINLINAQPVTYVSGSNYYTETDSEKKQMLQYLSDVRQNVKPKESTLYMSDESRKKKSDKQKSPHKSKSDGKIEIEETEIKEIKGLDNNSKSSESQKNKNKQNIDILENILEESNEDETENYDESSKSESVVIDINQFIAGDKQDGTKDLEVNNTKIESDENDTVNSGEESEDDSSEQSGYGNITLGSSKKGNNGIIPKFIIGKTNDNGSISTVDAEHINLKTLKSVDTYTKKELEKIAKVYSLPSTYKSDDGKRIQYKKEDLYQLIKDHLNTKNKNL